jgi:hypothetical protein
MERVVSRVLRAPGLAKVRALVEEQALLPSMRGAGIPALADDGRLPPGIWQASLGEALTRFGSGSPERIRFAEQLRAAAPRLREAGLDEIEVFGSWPTAKLAPSDVDFRAVRPEFRASNPELSALLGELRTTTGLHEFGATRQFMTRGRDSQSVAGTLLLSLD